MSAFLDLHEVMATSSIIDVRGWASEGLLHSGSIEVGVVGIVVASFVVDPLM